MAAIDARRRAAGDGAGNVARDGQTDALWCVQCKTENIASRRANALDGEGRCLSGDPSIHHGILIWKHHFSNSSLLETTCEPQSDVMAVSSMKRRHTHLANPPKLQSHDCPGEQQLSLCQQ